MYPAAVTPLRAIVVAIISTGPVLGISSTVGPVEATFPVEVLFVVVELFVVAVFEEVEVEF